MKIRILMVTVALSVIGNVQAAPPLTGPSARPAADSRAPAMDTDRAQVLAWTRELEAAPLAEDASAKRAWLMQWLKDVRGLKVYVCDVFGVLGEENQKLSSLMLQQYMFGSASYLIEHPSMDGHAMAVQLAGVASAVNAYAVVRKQDPLQRVVHFDQLLDLQAKGELPEYIESNVFAKCGKH